MYPQDIVVYTCAGVLSVTAIALVAIVVWHRRRAQAKQSTGSACEEAPAVTQTSCADISTHGVSSVPDESQPLLSESAIRSYYATNANEFARSYIDRTQPCSYVSRQSLGQDAGTAAFGEHVLTIVPTDSSDSEDSGIDSCAGEAETPMLGQHLNESYANAVASVLTTITPPQSEHIDQNEIEAGSTRSSIGEISRASSIRSAGSVRSDKQAGDSRQSHPLHDGSADSTQETQTDQPEERDCSADSAHDMSAKESPAQADNMADSANDCLETAVKAGTEDTSVGQAEVLAEGLAAEQVAEESSVIVAEQQAVEEAAKISVEEGVEETTRALPEGSAEQPVTELESEPAEEVSVPAETSLGKGDLGDHCNVAMDAEIKGDVTDTAISAETKGCVADTATSTETNGNFTDTAASAETKGAALGLTAKYNAAAAPSECSSRPRSSTLNAHAKAFVPGRKLGSQFAEDAATSTAIRRSASDESASRVDKPRSYTTGEDRQQTFERLAIGNRSSGSNSSRSRHHGSMSSSQSDRSNLSDRTAGSECPASDSQSVQHNNRDGDGDAGGDADDGEDGGGEDEDGDDAYESQQQTGVGAMAKRRCRFWPSCNNRNCKYRHPSQTCSTYPNCTFGNNCIYIHPCDVQKINSVISRMHGDGSRRPKRKHNDIVRLNNLSSYVKN